MCLAPSSMSDQQGKHYFFTLISHFPSKWDTKTYVGTRREMPVNFPLRSGRTLVTAFAAPVVVGITLPGRARPARLSRLLYPSSTSCDRVDAWTVVIRPWTIPNLPFRTLARGARQLIVQLAQETTVRGIFTTYSEVLIPHTKVGASLLGADINTLFAPANSTCRCARVVMVNFPVLSIIYSAPESAQSDFLGSRSDVKCTRLPHTDSVHGEDISRFDRDTSTQWTMCWVEQDLVNYIVYRGACMIDSYNLNILSKQWNS